MSLSREAISGCRTLMWAQRSERRVAVKAIDDRGNELLVVKSLDEAE